MSTTKSAPANRETDGPFDESEVSGLRPYVDLGSIKLTPREGLNLRLEVEEGTQRVVAVNLDYNGSTLQLQAFATSRSMGLWDEIREQIVAQVTEQGGSFVESEGPVGIELNCQLPAVINDRPGFQPVRFLGVDGPRWFLRGVIAGPAASDPAQGQTMVALFRDVVVVRGQSPMPPRDLLPLRVPAQASGSALER
jgi:hypothetical protein